MRTEQPISTLDLTKPESDRLSRLMRNVSVGSLEDIRSPFLQSLHSYAVLDMFTEQVFKPKRKSLSVTLQEIEAKQMDKYGPRSIAKPWKERKPSLLAHFDDGKSVSIDDDAKTTLSSVFPGERRLYPAAWIEVLGGMRRSTNSGLPELVRKGIVIDRMMSDLAVRTDANQFVYVLLDVFLDGKLPAVLFTRTQEQGKTRDVWGYPFIVLLMEGRFFLPVFQIVKDNVYLSALRGPDAVDEAITALIQSNRARKRFLLSEDFENYDATVQIQLQTVAFHVLFDYFQISHVEDFELVAEIFNTIGIVTPDGILQGPHGIPSGSWFTNLVGSIVHLFAHCHLFQHFDETPNRYTSQVMGDDGVVSIPKNINRDTVEDLYRELGLKFNADKTFVSDAEVIYLQRYYSPDYEHEGLLRGIYPVYRALNRLIHMERWDYDAPNIGKDYFSIRSISILENCKWHPLFEDLVKWVWRNDKYSLEYSQASLRRYLATLERKRGTTIRNQYSDYIEGINSFETVKILKRL